MGNVPLERLTSDRIQRIYHKHVLDSSKGMDTDQLMKAFEEVTEFPLNKRQAAKVLERAAKTGGGEFSDSLSKEDFIQLVKDFEFLVPSMKLVGAFLVDSGVAQEDAESYAIALHEEGFDTIHAVVKAIEAEDELQDDPVKMTKEDAEKTWKAILAERDRLAAKPPDTLALPFEPFQATQFVKAQESRQDTFLGWMLCCETGASTSPSTGSTH